MTVPGPRRSGGGLGPRELYLVRHAIAAERGPEWPDDDLRPLTDRGRARFEKAVAGIASLDVHIDEVLTSPLVRSRQTAQVLASGMPDHPPVTVLDALAPGHAPALVLEQLVTPARRRRLALVGHEPGLGELAAFLIGSRRPIPFKKGGACRIDLERLAPYTTGDLSWLLTPRILRHLAI